MLTVDALCVRCISQNCSSAKPEPRYSTQIVVAGLASAGARSDNIFYNGVCLKCGAHGRRAEHCPVRTDVYWRAEDWWYSNGWEDEFHQWVNFEIWNNQSDMSVKKDLVKKLRQETKGRAVLDCGATRCVAGIMALQALQDELLSEDIRMEMKPHERSRVRFGDNKTLITVGTAYIPWPHDDDKKLVIPVGILPNSPMPLLLSKRVLKDMKMTTDLGTNNITTPSLRSKKQYVQARESCTGHMMLPMTRKTWSADVRPADEEGNQVQVNLPPEPKEVYKSPEDLIPDLPEGVPSDRCARRCGRRRRNPGFLTCCCPCHKGQAWRDSTTAELRDHTHECTARQREMEPPDEAAPP